MTRFVANFLKAGLIGLLCVPLTLWAADSPRVKVNTDPIKPNTANIHFESVINGNNVMHATITSGSGQGCTAGQLWDVVVGGCTFPVKLRSLSRSEACDCSCGAGSTGSCTASRTGSYDVLGWRLPTDGREQVSGYSSVTWGACQLRTNSCKAETPPPPPPDNGGGSASVGDTYKITAMICTGAEQDYYTEPSEVPVAIRDRIISQYRSWSGGRCPEASGYKNWVSYVNTYAYAYWSPTPGVPDLNTYRAAYDIATAPAIDAGADANGEKTEAGLAAANHLCQLEANRRFGQTAQAVYVNGSGNQCIVTVP